MLSTEQLVELAKKNPENKKLQEDVAIAQRMDTDPEFRAQRRAEFQREFLEGVKFAPFRTVLGGVVDVANLPGQVLGIAPEKPFLGSDYMIDKYATGIEALGGSYRRPTGGGAELAGDIIGSTLNVAGVTKGLSRLFGKAFKKGQGKELQGTSTAQLDGLTSETAFGAPLEPLTAPLEPLTAPLDPPTSVLDPLEDARLPSVGAQGGVPLTKTNPIIAPAEEAVVKPTGYGELDSLGGGILNYSPTLTTISEIGISEKGMPAGQIMGTIIKRPGVSGEIRHTKFEKILKDNPDARYTEADLKALYDEHVPQTKVYLFTEGRDNYPRGYIHHSRDQLLPDIEKIEKEVGGVDDFGVMVLSTDNEVYLDNFSSQPYTLKGIEGHDYYGQEIPGYYGHVRFQDVSASFDGVDGMDMNTSIPTEFQSNIIQEFENFNTDMSRTGLADTVKNRNTVDERVYLNGEVLTALEDVRDVYEPVDYLSFNPLPEMRKVLSDADNLDLAQTRLNSFMPKENLNIFLYGQYNDVTPPEDLTFPFSRWYSTEVNVNKGAISRDPKTFALFFNLDEDFYRAELPKLGVDYDDLVSEVGTTATLETLRNKGVSEKVIDLGITHKAQQMAVNVTVNALRPYQLNKQFEISGIVDDFAAKYDLTDPDNVSRAVKDIRSADFSDEETLMLLDEAIAAQEEAAAEAKKLLIANNVSPKTAELLAEKELSNLRSVRSSLADVSQYDTSSPELAKLIRENGRGFAKPQLETAVRGRAATLNSAKKMAKFEEEVFMAEQAIDKNRAADPRYAEAEAQLAKAVTKAEENLKKFPKEQQELLRELNKTRDMTRRTNGYYGFIFKPPYNTQKEFVDFSIRAFIKKREDLGDNVDVFNHPDYRDIAAPSGRVGPGVNSPDKAVREDAENIALTKFGPLYGSQVGKSVQNLGKLVYGDSEFKPPMIGDPPQLVIGEPGTQSFYASSIGSRPSVQIPMDSTMREALKKPIRRAKGGPVDLRSGIGDMFKLYS